MVLRLGPPLTLPTMTGAAGQLPLFATHGYNFEMSPRQLQVVMFVLYARVHLLHCDVVECRAASAHMVGAISMMAIGS